MTPYLQELLNTPDFDIYPPKQSVTYDTADDALPPCMKTAKRLAEYIAAQPMPVPDGARFFGQMNFDGSVPADLFSRTGHEHFRKEGLDVYYNKPYDELITFEWQHSTPDYEKVIKSGLETSLNEIKESRARFSSDPERMNYLSAMETVIRAVEARANAYADTLERTAEGKSDVRKKELLRAAEALRRIPEKPARTFFEGVFAIYFCFDYLPDGVGTIDRYLYPLFVNDKKNGTLTDGEAKEYLQELFVHLCCHTPPHSANRNRGGECHFAIGGYLPDGSDGFTELSKLIAEALVEMPMHIPEISLRRTEKTPREVLRFMMDLERNDPYKRIAFVNDEPRIRSFMNYLGLSFEEAVRYTMVGCNEPAFPGVIWFGGSTFTVMRALTRTLYEDTERCVAASDFEEFYAVFREHLAEDMDEVIRVSDRFNEIRMRDATVLSAPFFDGPTKTGLPPTKGHLSVNLGGGEMMGLISLIDSLTVISEFVFRKHLFTMKQLIDNLKSNWQADPGMRTVILKTAPFFGNNEDASDEMARRLSYEFRDLVKDRRLAVGAKILFGTLAGYNPHHVVYGNLTPASPDGRRDKDPFMVGMGQSFGKDRAGTTALLSSVAGMDPSGIFAGPFVLNVKLDEKLIRDDVYFEKTVDETEAYFKMGGMQIQFNYVSREDLLRAREYPENYRAMKVRVSGWSGVFVDLDKRLQDDVISRTEKHGY